MNMTKTFTPDGPIFSMLPVGEKIVALALERRWKAFVVPLSAPYRTTNATYQTFALPNRRLTGVVTLETAIFHAKREIERA